MDLHDLNFRQFEAFSAVMWSGSITGAAKKLGCSQPTVTRLIKEFESTLGFELLHRNGPRISPTERGVEFHREVEGLLISLGHLQERVIAIRSASSPSVHIVATPALAVSIVPHALSLLPPETLPRHVVIESYGVDRVIQTVLARTADFGITSFPVEHSSIETHWVAEAACVVALPENHPLAAKSQVRLKDLAGERIIADAHPQRHRTRLNEALSQSGVALDRVMDTNASINSLALTRAGLGVALVEPATAHSLPIAGIVVRPLDIYVPFYFGAVTALATPLTPPTQAVIAATKTAAAHLIPNTVFRKPGSIG